MSNPRVGVVDFKFGEHWMRVRFADGRGYEYTTNSVGEKHLAEMKRLALKGVGLSAYIADNCRTRFTRCL